MKKYNKTFDSNMIIGHCDLHSWFGDFAFNFQDHMICENMSWFSDFAPYSLHCGLYEKCAMFLCVRGPNVRPQIEKGHCDLYFMVQ